MECGYLDQEKIVEPHWIGFVTEKEPAKEACLAIMDCVRDNQASGLLNDNTRQRGPWPELDGWLEGHWLPGLEAAGLKRFAHVHSENIFTSISAQKALKASFNDMAIHHFKSRGEALAWLLER